MCEAGMASAVEQCSTLAVASDSCVIYRRRCHCVALFCFHVCILTLVKLRSRSLRGESPRARFSRAALTVGCLEVLSKW